MRAAKHSILFVIGVILARLIYLPEMNILGNSIRTYFVDELIVAIIISLLTFIFFRKREEMWSFVAGLLIGIFVVYVWYAIFFVKM